jgi:hypothetical protein
MEDTDDSEGEVPRPVQGRQLRRHIEDSDSEETDPTEPRVRESEDDDHTEGTPDPASEVDVPMHYNVGENSVSRASTRPKHKTDIPLSHTHA